MKGEIKFTQIIDRCFEDPKFREQLVSDNIDDRKNALAEYFVGEPERLDEALGAMNRILDSPARDAMREFFQYTDPDWAPAL